jgi:hypothetical protein
MVSTAPVLTPLLSSHRSHQNSITVKTKAPEDDDVGNNGVGMVVIVVTVSGTIAFVPVDRRPPCLVDDHHPVAIALPLLI